MSEMQTFWWIERLRGNIAGPVGKPRYHLVGQHCARTVAYACDYGLYMHDLASDIGAVPDVWCWLFKSWRTALAYSMGQAYIPFFRLDGPFATPSAQLISETELYNPVVDRAVASNLLFGSLTLTFGGLSCGCWVVQQVLNCIPFVNV
jgi:dimethylaniline monooxygenase (N-oxide forming)